MNNDKSLLIPSEPFLTNSIVLFFLVGATIVLTGLLFYYLKNKKRSQPTPPQVDNAKKASAPLSDVDEIKNLDQGAWLQKLRTGLDKTRNALLSNLQNLFQGNPINEDMLNTLHETLYRSDISAKAVDRLLAHLRLKLKENRQKDVKWESIKETLSEEMERILEIPSVPTQITGPQIVLVIGVNGVGKTTTIGKLAAHYLAENKSVLLCAADTYRAAAIDQLQIWGTRLGVKVVAHQEGSDPAAVVFDSVKAAVARGVDVLLIDTAGRLHNKKHLMDELAKITRVMKKEIPDAPHETLLVLDATTGQNALMQLRSFQEITKITGICLTKLDGTAKGGVILGLADEFQIPIKYIGVGEKSSDLRKFEAKDFVRSLLS